MFYIWQTTRSLFLGFHLIRIFVVIFTDIDLLQQTVQNILTGKQFYLIQNYFAFKDFDIEQNIIIFWDIISKLLSDHSSETM